MLHHLDQERPCNGVKSLGDINFQQYSRELPAVQPTARQSHGSEIVMDGLSPIVGRFPCGAGQVILGGELKQGLQWNLIYMCDVFFARVTLISF